MAQTQTVTPRKGRERIQRVGFSDPRFVVPFYDVIAGARRQLDSRMPCVVIGYEFAPGKDDPEVQVFATHSGKLTTDLIRAGTRRIRECIVKEKTVAKAPMTKKSDNKRPPNAKANPFAGSPTNSGKTSFPKGKQAPPFGKKK